MSHPPVTVEQDADGTRRRPAGPTRAGVPAPAADPRIDGPVSRAQLSALQRAAGNRAATALVRSGRAGPSPTVVQRDDRDGGTALLEPGQAGVAGPVPDAGPEQDTSDAGPGQDARDVGPEPDAPDAGPEPDAPDAGPEQVTPAAETPGDGGASPDATSSEQAGPAAAPVTAPSASREPDRENLDGGGPPVDVLAEERRACLLEPDPAQALAEEWGLPGSPERQAKVTEAVERANFWTSLGEGAVTGGGVALATAVAQSGVARFMATRGISQAAKAAGPAGAIIAGALSGYVLWKKFTDPTSLAAVMNLGNVWSQGTGDELWANRFHVIAEVLDVIGNLADVVSGGAGAVAVGGTLIGLIPGMQWVLPAVPIATKISFWAGVVGLVLGVLKTAAQYISRKFRENHLLHMELSDEASLRAQQAAITATAKATYNFVGGMAASGALALGGRSTGGRAQEGAQAQGRPMLGPLEATSVRARQAKTPKQLETLRQVDDAVGGRRPGTAPPDEVGQGRSATDARAAEADAAGQQHSAATREAEGARARAEEASGQVREAGDNQTARTREVDEAARNLEDTTSRARADADSPASRGNQLSEAARQHSERAADYDRRAADLEPSLSSARQQRDETMAARDQKQREVEQATAAEAAALRQYEGMERGQMALAIARDAGRRRQAAQAELDALDARLPQLEAEARRLEVEHGAMRDLAGRERAESARLSGEAAAEAHGRAEEVGDARRAWEDARREAEQARRELDDRMREADQARQAERDRAAAARQAERDVAGAHGRLEEAHGAEVASQREAESGVVREVAEKGIGGGGIAQNVTGAGSQTTPAKEEEVEVPVTGQVPAPPTSSAAVEQLNVSAAAHATIAAQAREQQREAEAEVGQREASGRELDRMSQEVGAVRGTAGQTADALGEKAQRRSTLEANSAEVSEQMGVFGEKMSDLTTFASFVGRILEYASGLTHDLMPSAVQNAGQRMLDVGQSVQENVDATQAGIGERRAVEGADAERRNADRLALDASQQAMPATDGDLGASVEQLEEKKQGNEEIRTGAAESAAANASHAAQAQARSEAALAERDSSQAALEAWAAEARQCRQDEVEQTKDRLEEQGYDVTDVVGA